MENVLAGTRMAMAVRSALSEYLAEELVNRIMEEIGERYIAERTNPSYDEMIAIGKAFSGAPVQHHSGPVYRPASEPDAGYYPDEEYPDESPANPRLRRAEYLPQGEVRSRMLMGAYIKENTETGVCALYDRTGTYIGGVNERTLLTMHRDNEIAPRAENETYVTYWIREGRE